MNTKQSGGFTLIELLVVIAIIGILSSVVLASLNTARSKGVDAAIIADMDGLRTQAQLYLTDGNTYNASGVAVANDCVAADTLFVEGTVSKQIAGADTKNGAGTVTCNASADGTEYAVAAELVATPGTYYCVDSKGLGITTVTALGTNTGC